MSLISKDIPFVPIGNEQVITNKPPYGVINARDQEILSLYSLLQMFPRLNEPFNISMCFIDSAYVSLSNYKKLKLLFWDADSYIYFCDRIGMKDHNIYNEKHSGRLEQYHREQDSMIHIATTIYDKMYLVGDNIEKRYLIFKCDSIKTIRI